MPMFVVNTNVPKRDVPADLLSEATEELAKALGKPVQVGRIVYNLRSLFMRGRSRFTLKSSNTSTNASSSHFAGSHRSR